MKHNWNSLYNYVDIHKAILFKYTYDYSNGPKYYSITRPQSDILSMTCEPFPFQTYSGNSIMVEIEKTAEVHQNQARTIAYSYNSWNSESKLISYHSPHYHHNQIGYTPPAHHQYHHKHNGTHIQVMNNSWPHVSEFFVELLESC